MLKPVKLVLIPCEPKKSQFWFNEKMIPCEPYLVPLCPHCNKDYLQECSDTHIDDDYYLACPVCDSTYNLFDKEHIIQPEQIGLVGCFNSIGGTILELLSTKHASVIHENNNLCFIQTQEICTNYKGKHIGKDCSCKSGFKCIPYFKNNKAIIHLKNYEKN